MPISFKTLGPFELKRDGNRLNPAFLRELWSPDIRSLDKVFRYAIGVYVIAIKENGKLLPLYVGKSNRGFANRLGRHSVFQDIPAKYDGESLFLFLLARVTSERGKYLRAKRQTVETPIGTRSQSSKLKSIDELEFALIGTCLKINPDLLNKHEKSFLNAMRVPGYLNVADKDLNQSAITLKGMLT